MAASMMETNDALAAVDAEASRLRKRHKVALAGGSSTARLARDLCAQLRAAEQQQTQLRHYRGGLTNKMSSKKLSKKLRSKNVF